MMFAAAMVAVAITMSLALARALHTEGVRAGDDTHLKLPTTDTL